MFTTHSVESDRIVYTPAAFARSSLFHLQETGTLRAVKPHTSTRSGLASYLFFRVLGGRGNLEYEGTWYNLSAGDCVFIDCRIPYSHTTDTDLWQLQWVHFNGESMSGIYDNYRERGGRPVFRPDSTEPYAGLCDELYQLASSDDFLRDMRIHEKLSSLLTLLMETSRDPLEGEARKRGAAREYSLQDIKNYLDGNWTRRITLDELADRFGINKFYLTRLFKNQYGATIVSYVQDVRITQAKRRLRFSEDTVESIAAACGFEDQNYFARIFRKIEGVTPTEYRKMWVQ